MHIWDGVRGGWVVVDLQEYDAFLFHVALGMETMKCSPLIAAFCSNLQYPTMPRTPKNIYDAVFGDADTQGGTSVAAVDLGR